MICLLLLRSITPFLKSWLPEMSTWSAKVFTFFGKKLLHAAAMVEKDE